MNDSPTPTGATNVILNQRSLTPPYHREPVHIQGDEHTGKALGFDGAGILTAIAVGGTVQGYVYDADGSIAITAGGTDKDIVLDASGAGGVKFPRVVGAPVGHDAWIRVPWLPPVYIPPVPPLNVQYVQPDYCQNLIIGNGGTNITRAHSALTNPVNPVSQHGQSNGVHCTFFGIDAGVFNTTGSYNTFLGSNAGRACVNGDQNTYIGSDAGQHTSNGYMNVAVGADCCNHLTTGYLNVFVGCDCGNTAEVEMTGFGNVAMGAGAGRIGSANRSVFIGAWSGTGGIVEPITGDNNVCVGASTMGNPKNAVDNTAVGTSALSRTTGTVTPNEGCYNTAVGCFALSENTIGQANVAVGRQALVVNTTGSNNIAVGQNALKSNTTASGNVAVGDHALFVNTTGALNTAVGSNALFNGNGSENTATGHGALQNNSGSYNAAFGVGALFTNGGDSNAAFGRNALYGNTTGASNTAVGAAAMQNATTTYSSTAVGMQALFRVTTGTQNTAVGSEALYNCVTGARNVALGMRAGTYELGSDAFYVDNQDRGNTAGDKAGALLYGTFSATPANQTLRINAVLQGPVAINGNVVAVNDYGYGWGDGTTMMWGNAASEYLHLRTNGFDRLSINSAGTVTLAQRVIHALSETPASATAAGVAGTVSWDTGFLYVCTATNTWKRVALAAW